MLVSTNTHDSNKLLSCKGNLKNCSDDAQIEYFYTLRSLL